MNAGLLKRAKQQSSFQLTEALVERVTRCFDLGPIILRELCAATQFPPGAVPVLLVHGLLAARLARHPIRDTLELSLADGDLSHLCLIEAVER